MNNNSIFCLLNNMFSKDFDTNSYGNIVKNIIKSIYTRNYKYIEDKQLYYIKYSKQNINKITCIYYINTLILDYYNLFEQLNIYAQLEHLYNLTMKIYNILITEKNKLILQEILDEPYDKTCKTIIKFKYGDIRIQNIDLEVFMMDIEKIDNILELIQVIID